MCRFNRLHVSIAVVVALSYCDNLVGGHRTCPNVSGGDEHLSNINRISHKTKENRPPQRTLGCEKGRPMICSCLWHSFFFFALFAANTEPADVRWLRKISVRLGSKHDACMTIGREVDRPTRRAVFKPSSPCQGPIITKQYQ